MPETRQPRDVPAAGGLWAHGQRMAAHRHTHGQVVYPAAGVLAVTTRHGTWMAPANRVTWTPAGFDHSHRAYGDTDVRMLQIPAPGCTMLPDRPAVFAVSPLLREALLVLTGDRRLRADARRRLREVAVDELTAAPEQSLYLPEPADDRLRAVTDRLYADPADPSTLTQLGRAVGASERTLSRLFRTELAMSFHQWRTQLRVQYSLMYLADGHSVTRTATLCGWSNTTSFIEAFTRILGQTPGRYQGEPRRARR
jgi:AraC-like DNA-binding protein